MSETVEKLSDRLLIACEDGDERLVRELVSKGARVDYLSPEGDSPLMAACRAGHNDTVRYLVQDKRADLDLQANGVGEGWTALMFAGFYGHASIVRYLVEMGANYTIRNADGQTVLEIEPVGRAALADIQESVALGVQNRADATPIHTFTFYETPATKNKDTANATQAADVTAHLMSTLLNPATGKSSRGTGSADPTSSSHTAAETAWSAQEAEGGVVTQWRQNQPVVTEKMDIAAARPRILRLYRSLCGDFGAVADARVEYAVNDASGDIAEAGMGAFDLRNAHIQHNKYNGQPPLPEHYRLSERERVSRAVKLGDLGILPLLEVLSHAMPQAPIHTLDLSYSDIGDVSVKVIASWLAQSRCVAVLNLEGNNITAKGAEALAAALPGQRSLRQLVLSRNPIGTVGVAALCEALIHGNETLVSLDLADTGAGAVGCLRVAAAMACPTLPLVRVNLDAAMSATDAASVVPHIAKALPYSRVQALSLCKCGLRDEEVQWLAQWLGSNSTVSELNLRANRITATGTAVMAMALRLRREPCFVNLDGNLLREQLMDEVYAVCDAAENDESLDHFCTDIALGSGKGSRPGTRPVFVSSCEFSTGEPLDEARVDRYSDSRHCLISRPYH